MWHGSIFNCNNAVVLPHSDFNNRTRSFSCNEGDIEVMNLREENNSYTSQLKVNISLSTTGDIKCIHDDNNLTDKVIGQEIFSSGKYIKFKMSFVAETYRISFNN